MWMDERQAGRAVCGLLLCLSACGEADSQSTEPDPSQRLPGGETTNTLLFGANAFKQPVSNITPQHESLFYTGNSFFNSAWVQAPSSTEARDGLGPLFNARSCSACHLVDGRGRPPLEPDEPFLGLLLRLGTGERDDHGAPAADDTYGDQLQPFAISNVGSEGTPHVTYEPVAGAYPDGEEYELLKPTYRIDDMAYGPPAAHMRISPRVAPAMIGLGLLEAIPEARLRELADPDDADGDGISGRLNHVWDRSENDHAIGRFGWKAEQPTIRQQVAGAFLGDLGITSSLFQVENCTAVQLDCAAAEAGGAPEIEDRLFDRVVAYSHLLAVPERARWDTSEILSGQALFADVGCPDCHTPRHETGPASFDELSDQVIWAYTDLLLHDMGEALSDDRPAFDAEGREWRTPPLWGIGRVPDVNRHDRLLHDGRARGVAEAILWHGGEGEPARDRFTALSSEERALVVRFVESL